MVAIIIPKSPGAIDRPFSDLVTKPEDLKKVIRTMTNALALSFDQDEKDHGVGFRLKIQTQQEVKRRTDILGRWFRVLRGDCGLGLIRCLDELPKALRKEINGEEYTPPEKSRLWTPEGAR
jgi:hypothetical protein